MWEARFEIVPAGMRFHIVQGRSLLTFHELFALLENNTEFAQWYSETLASCAFAAFFWELPALTLDTFEREAEFVLIESVSLAGLAPNLAPFESNFAIEQGTDVLTFPNLGGDALLIVPTPIGAIDVYTHLAKFLRAAPKSQIRSLWKTTAGAVRENLSPIPKWLSTAGLGVSWLHLRLDSRPKYYRYTPYK